MCMDINTEPVSPIDTALAHLKKLDTQFVRGLLSEEDLDLQRLVVLSELIIAKQK